MTVEKQQAWAGRRDSDQDGAGLAANGGGEE